MKYIREESNLKKGLSIKKLLIVSVMFLMTINIFSYTSQKDLAAKKAKKLIESNPKNDQAEEERKILEENNKEDATEDSILNLSIEDSSEYKNYIEEKSKISNFYNEKLYKIIDNNVLSLIGTPIEKSTFSSYYKKFIPIISNEYVEKQVELLTGKRIEFLVKSLKRAEPFIEEMKEILRKENVPEEMAYLPLIESGYSNFAVSRKGATGMWQFMPRTAKWIGMDVNSMIDERRDPIIACQYAAKYLNLLYNKFGDWYLVLASYNHGGGNVLKETKKVNSNDFYDLVRKKATPLETRNYVPRFIASLVIIKNIEKYEIDYKEEKSKFVYFQLPFATPAHLVAKYCELSLDEFIKYNPALKASFIPETSYNYNIRLPIDKHERLMENMDALKKDSSLVYLPYFVSKGDTLSGIAQKYGISIAVIMSANNLKQNGILSIGQRLFIPVMGYKTGK